MLLTRLAKPRAEYNDPSSVHHQGIDAMAVFINNPLANWTTTDSYWEQDTN